MKIRNAYSETPRNDDGEPAGEWFNVEQEPGICVAGEDSRFDVPTYEEANTMATNLAATSGPEYPLTVVKHTRQELAKFSVKTSIERREL